MCDAGRCSGGGAGNGQSAGAATGGHCDAWAQHPSAHPTPHVWAVAHSWRAVLQFCCAIVAKYSPCMRSLAGTLGADCVACVLCRNPAPFCDAVPSRLGFVIVNCSAAAISSERHRHSAHADMVTAQPGTSHVKPHMADFCCHSKRRSLGNVCSTTVTGRQPLSDQESQSDCLHNERRPFVKLCRGALHFLIAAPIRASNGAIAARGLYLSAGSSYKAKGACDEPWIAAAHKR